MENKTHEKKETANTDSQVHQHTKHTTATTSHKIRTRNLSLTFDLLLMRQLRTLTSSAVVASSPDLETKKTTKDCHHIHSSIADAMVDPQKMIQAMRSAAEWPQNQHRQPQQCQSIALLVDCWNNLAALQTHSWCCFLRIDHRHWLALIHDASPSVLECPALRVNVRLVADFETAAVLQLDSSVHPCWHESNLPVM